MLRTKRTTSLVGHREARSASASDSLNVGQQVERDRTLTLTRERGRETPLGRWFQEDDLGAMLALDPTGECAEERVAWVRRGGPRVESQGGGLGIQCPKRPVDVDGRPTGHLTLRSDRGAESRERGSKGGAGVKSGIGLPAHRKEPSVSPSTGSVGAFDSGSMTSM